MPSAPCCPCFPRVEEFPYAIRLVSEVLSSNGSTSQASICGSTLALMDAGVPIKAPVAGISCGLITEGDRWMTMVDIQGVEDFYGDMDFKVGGTHNGITAIQMDMKVDGLTYEIIEEAFEKCRKARLYILDEIMLPVIAEPRAELSKYAPKMLSIKIDVDKIRDVIGKGGKVIQKICADCNARSTSRKTAAYSSPPSIIEDAERAMHTIKTIVEDPEIGAIYKGKVTRLMTFGAFVEIAPGKEGLVHISKLDTKRVEKVEDVVGCGRRASGQGHRDRPAGTHQPVPQGRAGGLGCKAEVRKIHAAPGRFGRVRCRSARYGSHGTRRQSRIETPKGGAAVLLRRLLACRKSCAFPPGCLRTGPLAPFAAHGGFRRSLRSTRLGTGPAGRRGVILNKKGASAR